MRRSAPSLRRLRLGAGSVLSLALAACMGKPGVVLTPETISARGPTVPQYVSHPQVDMNPAPAEPVVETFPVDELVRVAEAGERDESDNETGGLVAPGTPQAVPGVGLQLPRNGRAPLVRGLWSDILLPADWEGYTTLVSKRRQVPVSFAPPENGAALVAADPDTVVVERGGDRSWRYNNLLPGQTVTVGSMDATAPMWGQGVQLGGLQISSWPAGANAVLPEGEFGYSSTVGGLASTHSTATQGSYATSAGSSSVRYGLTDQLTVESQVQGATAMNLVGVGGMYSLGSWGTLAAGHAQSRYNMEEGHRVSLGYRYDARAFSLNFRNDYSTPGFADLAAYHDGTTANQRLSNSVRADVPLSGWGTFSGTFVGLRDGDSSSNRVGVLHQMNFSRNVNLGLGADRDISSGEVSMHMNVSMPVEVFVGGLRLPLMPFGL